MPNPPADVSLSFAPGTDPADIIYGNSEDSELFPDGVDRDRMEGAGSYDVIYGEGWRRAAGGPVEGIEAPAGLMPGR